MSDATTAPLKELALADVERELSTARRVLERLPDAQFRWKPHEKSMSLGDLATHVANLVQWAVDTLEKDELDLAATPPMRGAARDRSDLLEMFDRNVAAFRAALARTDDAALRRTWSLRHGDAVLFSQPKASILRVWCLNHLVHHRAQLCVYLRLLNEPVPAVYFNSADEPDWQFA